MKSFCLNFHSFEAFVKVFRVIGGTWLELKSRKDRGSTEYIFEFKDEIDGFYIYNLLSGLAKDDKISITVKEKPKYARKYCNIYTFGFEELNLKDYKIEDDEIEEIESGVFYLC